MSLVVANETGWYGLVARTFREWFEEVLEVFLKWFWGRREEVAEKVYEVVEKVGGAILEVMGGPAKTVRGYFVWYLVAYVLVTPGGWQEKFFSLVGIWWVYNYY